MEWTINKPVLTHPPSDVPQDLTGAESLEWCRRTLEEHGWDLDPAARSALNMPPAEVDRPAPVAAAVRSRRGGGGKVRRSRVRAGRRRRDDHRVAAEQVRGLGEAEKVSCLPFSEEEGCIFRRQACL